MHFALLASSATTFGASLPGWLVELAAIVAMQLAAVFINWLLWLALEDLDRTCKTMGGCKQLTIYCGVFTIMPLFCIAVGFGLGALLDEASK